MKSYTNKMFRPISAQSIGLFRLILGFVLLFETIRLFRMLPKYYLNQEMYFSWQYFDFIHPISPIQFKIVLIVMAIASLLTIIGFKSRYAMSIYLIGYVYFILVEASYFNNHYYFLALIIFIYIWHGNGDKWASIQNRNCNDELIPKWNLLILRFQISIVYVLAGVAKLNVDWLSTNTMRAVYKYSSDYKALKSWMNEDVFAYFFTFSGIGFDILVGLLLWHRLARYWVIPFILVFHLINLSSLNIGVFPFLMAATTILFLEPDFPARIFERVRHKTKNGVNNNAPIKFKYSSMLILGIGFYMTIQVLLPFRHFIVKGNVDWTGEANNYAWRMKIGLKHITDFKIYLFNRYTKEEYDTQLNLNPNQYQMLALNPLRTIQVAAHLSDKIDVAKDSLAVYVKMEVMMNDRPVSLLVDSTANLLTLSSLRLAHNPFIYAEPEDYFLDQQYWLGGFFNFLYKNKFRE